MANIFSGIFANSGQGQAAALARYQQELKDYQTEKDAYEQDLALQKSKPAYDRMTEFMDPRLKSIADYHRANQGSEQMFDSANIGSNRVVGQQGDTVKQELAQDAQLDRYKLERDYLLAHPDPTDVPNDIQLYEYFNKLSPEEQLTYLLAKRAPKHLDLLTYFEDPVSGEKFGKDVKGLEWLEGVGKDEADSWLAFPDTMAAGDTFLRDNDNKRDAVQRMFGATSGGTTGWEAIFSIIPEHDAHQWKLLKEEVVANLGLDKLMEMKAGSSSGASGMGALSDTEMAILQRIHGDLSQTSDPKAIKIILRKLDRTYAKMTDDRKRKLRRLYRKNQSLESRRKLHKDRRYQVPGDYEYILDPKGKMAAPVIETPLTEENFGEMTDEQLLEGL